MDVNPTGASRVRSLALLVSMLVIPTSCHCPHSNGGGTGQPKGLGNRPWLRLPAEFASDPQNQDMFEALDSRLGGDWSQVFAALDVGPLATQHESLSLEDFSLGLAATGLTSEVSFTSSNRGTGATVRFQLLGQQSNVHTSKQKTDVAKETMTIGIYRVWYERDDKPSSKEHIFDIIDKAESISIEESEK